MSAPAPDKAGGKPPRIVAELGRPETPEETAARKAENTRKHYSQQTLRNLILSLLATVAVVIVLVAVVVRPGTLDKGTVDYHAIANQSQVNAAAPLANPTLPSTWTANSAALTTGTDKIATWYVGFITPKDQFISLEQGIAANPTWVSQKLNSLPPTGTSAIDGQTWDVYDHRTAKDPGNLAYALTLVVGTQTYVLAGTADDSEFADLATAIIEGQR